MRHVIAILLLATACSQVKWLPPENARLLEKASHTRAAIPTRTTMGEAIDLHHDDTILFLDDQGVRTPAETFETFQLEEDVLMAVTAEGAVTRVPLDSLTAIGQVDYSRTWWLVAGILVGAALVIPLIVVTVEMPDFSGGLGSPF